MGKIPFGLLPGSWGLKGKTRKIAEIEYYKTGIEKERAIADVTYEDDPEGLALEHLKIDVKWKKKSRYDANVEAANIQYTGQELKERLLEIELQHEKITDLQYEKGLSDLRGEPWVRVANSSFSAKRGPDGFAFELDYNEKFVEMLRESGFEGRTDEQVVNEWFNELCRQVAVEDSVDGSPTAETFVGYTPRTIQQEIGPDGKIKYS